MPKTKGYERTETVACIEKAVESHKIIDIEYLNVNGETKKYRLQPYKIVNYECFWYLYTLKDGIKRTFKLNNIKNCNITKQSFKPIKSIIEKLDESVNIWFELDKKIKVRLSVDKEVSEFFKAKEYFPNQKIIKTQKNGNLIIETTIGRYEEITHIIFSWIPFIKVIFPKKLQLKIIDKLSFYSAAL